MRGRTGIPSTYDLRADTAQAGRCAPRSALAAICCAAMFLYAIYMGAVSVLLPAIGLSFGLGTAAQGALFPATFGSYVCGVLLCGALSDRFGRKRLVLIGTAVYAAGLIAFGVSRTFPEALLASLLIGSGSGAMEAVASVLAADLFPERSAFIINLMQVAYGVGSSCGPTLVHSLLQLGFDWRPLYVALAVANLGLFLLLAPLRTPATSRSASGWSMSALAAVARQPVFWLLCLAEALYVGSEAGFYQWMPTYFIHRGWTALAGICVTAYWIAMTVGRVGAGTIVERFRYIRLAAALAIAAAAASALTLAAGSPGIATLCMALTGLGMSAIFGLVLAEANSRFPSLTGTVFGAVVSSGGVGGAIVPMLVGTLAESHGWHVALGIIPALSLGVAALGLTVARIPRGIEA